MIRIGVEAVDALSTLLTTLNQCADSFLDLKYYASNVLAKIKENICLDRWRELLAKPPNAQVVEDGNVFYFLVVSHVYQEQYCCVDGSTLVKILKYMSNWIA